MKFYIVKGDRGGWLGGYYYVVKDFSTVRKIFDREISAWLNQANLSWDFYNDEDHAKTYDEWLDITVNDYREFGDLVYWEEATFDDKLFE